MLPAPAQGAMLIVAKEKDEFCRNALAALNHKDSNLCVHVEREFLRTLEGGCTAPIGALAVITDGEIKLHGALFGLDGSEKFEVRRSVPVSESKGFGKACADEILNAGGNKLMKQIKAAINKE